MKTANRKPKTENHPASPWTSLSLGLLLLLVIILILSQAGRSGAGAAPPGKEALMEELHFQVDVWVWRDALKSELTLRRLGPDRYRAEIAGQTQGLLSLITRNWQGRFTTEMIYRQGRLMPVIYREEARHGKRHHLKEYRFDYTGQRLELRQREDDHGMVKKWETPLKEPIYDVLSLFYNQRLGLLGEFKEGETLKIRGIPYPKPEEISVRLGATTPEGRQVMISLFNRVFEDSHSDIFAYFDADWVPTQGWTRVLRFGKIRATLLPGGRRLREGPGAVTGEPLAHSALDPR